VDGVATSNGVHDWDQLRGRDVPTDEELKSHKQQLIQALRRSLESPRSKEVQPAAPASDMLAAELPDIHR
jgi:hypothetical protein